MTPSSTSDEPVVPPTLSETLPDGRVVEMVNGTWAEASPDDPSNALPADITLLIDGELCTVRILLTDEMMREAFEHGTD